MGMTPTILNAYHNGKQYTQGYDEKADIWSLGSLCYELLLGHTAFNAESFDELVNKVENGTYNIPTNLSKEVVSFLNGMLQYDPKKRYSANQLANHPFLIKRVQDFHRMDLRKVSKNVVNGKLKINVKKNQTIWAIFNKEDEQKLLSIGDLNNNLNPTNTSLKPINESMALGNSNFKNYIPPGGKNLYGISMYPKDNSSQQISMSAKVSDFSNKMNNQPANNYPTFNTPTIDMNNYLNINKSNNIPPPNDSRYNSQLSQDINYSNYIPANNQIVDENEKGSGCNIY
jgi:serine/threonine protein kinase